MRSVTIECFKRKSQSIAAYKRNTHLLSSNDASFPQNTNVKTIEDFLRCRSPCCSDHLVKVFISRMRKGGAVSSLAIFLLISFIHFSVAKPLQQLEVGATLSANNHDTEFLTSPDNTFCFGFYEVGNNAYLLGTWFSNSQNKTVVWTANRDRPVSGRGSELSLMRNGAIVLSDVDGTVVWEANSNYTTSNVVSKAQLLDTGNLVIRSTQDNILWQSFDYPTDTLVPTQTFTKSKRLLSPLRKGSYESGYYNMYYDSNNVLTLVFDGPEISSLYWPIGDIYQAGRTNYNSSRIASIDHMGRFLSSDLLHFNASDMGYGIKRRLTLDYDGNLRVYSLINATGLWEITWQAIEEPCTIHGLCGRNGLCVYTPELKCTCPPGFNAIDTSDWSRGCKRNSSLTKSTAVKFLKLPHTDYYGYDLFYNQSIGLEACRNSCISNIQCEAFSYRSGAGQCYPKSALFSGYQSPDVVGSLYLKVPENLQSSGIEIPSSSSSNVICNSQKAEIVGSYMFEIGNKKVKWVYLYSFSCAIGAIEVILFALGWCLLFRKTDVTSAIEMGYEIIANQFKRFSYTELKKATKNFKEELGRGGSGSVYKGVLTDGREVAIKRLGDTGQAEQEFQAETNTIGKINHMNLVRMYGYCSERNHRLLVYEYIKNSSLDKHLFGSNFLGWKERFVVALGSAKGLAYLHHECLEWIIHCDVKPENILLDNEFQPKIADFGLAKLSQRGEGAGSVYTRIRGTKGYMAPEWALNLPITAKVDVYGYGVVILEMVRGRRMSNSIAEESELNIFVRKVQEEINHKGEKFWVKSIVDPRLEGKFSRKEAETLIKIGVSCVEEDRNRRPTMDRVVQALLECQE